MIEDEEPLKKCSKCGEWKLVSEFYNDKSCKDGLRRQCKECIKKYYNENKDHYANYRKTHYIRNWCTSTLNQHNKLGYIVNITIDELYTIAIDKPCCAICNSELDWTPGHGRTNTSPTLDRLYNSNDLNITNIVILCSRCNTKKYSDSIEENLLWCKQFENFAKIISKR